MKSILSVWKTNLDDRLFRKIFIVTIIFLVIVLFTLSNFLTYNDTLSGVAYVDPILKYVTPVNVTWLTFLLIYSALLTGLVYLIRHPRYLLVALQAYAIMAIFRICVMYSLPLDPVPGTIALEDPFVQLFGNGQILMRDLFFSGHTSTMFLLFLSAHNKKLKTMFLIFTVLVGLAVMVQHAHYTVDVLAAPFFAYASYRISVIWNTKLGLINNLN